MQNNVGICGDVLCGTKFLREFNFADWRFFCVLRKLIFAIERHLLFLAGN